jgi:hypothetical protein
MLNYAVVRTDNMAGTDVRSMLVSVKYMGADGQTPTEIENGNVLKLGALMDGEREVHIGAAVAANTPINEVVLVATPEVNYESYLRALDDFINKADTICRGYRLHSGDFFSVTKGALAGASEPAVGDVVELAAGTKLSVVAAATGATNGSTVVGSIHAIETVGQYTFYVIKVA